MPLTLPKPEQHSGAPVRRVFPLEIRAQGDPGQSTTIEGYAVAWESVNSYGEMFVPGAFAANLAEKSDLKPLVMAYQHREAIGKWSTFEEDDKGLRLSGTISDTSTGRDAATLVRDGALTGLSVGFWPEQYLVVEPGETAVVTTPRGTFTYTFDSWTWLILEAEIVETSLVLAPADDDARVTSVRSASEHALRALPGLAADDADWEDVAYSMALLMGGRGAGQFRDMPAHQRKALHGRLVKAYERHSKTAPEFDPEPDYQKVSFRYDERDVFTDRYLRKTLDTLTAGASGVSGPLSTVTRDAAHRAVAALNPLLKDEGQARRERLVALRDGIEQITTTLKGATDA